MVKKNDSTNWCVKRSKGTIIIGSIRSKELRGWILNVFYINDRSLRNKKKYKKNELLCYIIRKNLRL